MRLIRILAGLVGLLLMGAGYLFSLIAFFEGKTADYTARLDASPIPTISLILLLLAVVLSALPQGSLVVAEDSTKE